MIYGIARFLQLAGLVILPLAVMGNIAEQIDLKTELMLAGFGIAIFIMGWWLQRTVKK